MSMMIDLGLHKKLGLAKMAPIINQRRTLRRNMERTLDERRAYLGLFYMHCVYVSLANQFQENETYQML
jgi:hypothetical protein